MVGKMFRLAAFVFVCTAYAAAAQADNVWANLMSNKRVEADPAKKYELKEDNGPWTIMACSFSGTGAAAQAHDLVLELRRRNKLEAYVYEHSFALEDPNQSALSATASPYRHQYRRFADKPGQFDGSITEVAVMIGNYPAIDDVDAQNTLDKIKSSEPDCLMPKEDQPQSRSLARLRIVQDGIYKFLVPGVQGRKHVGPMSHAFITRNPLLPEEYFVQRGGVDDFVLRINKGVEYSLLDCPGKYTVQVAHFTGEIIIRQSDVQAIESGQRDGPEKNKQSLADAARKAHELCVALRVKKYEAYEFHDRYCSLVTVGSFNSVGTPRADGKIEINPDIHFLMQRFSAKAPPAIAAQQMPGCMQLESLVGIYFDAQAIPVQVPKRSIPHALGQRLDVAGQ